VEEAEVSVGYASSGAGVSYSYRVRPAAIELEIEGDARDVACHLLLPGGANVRSARVNGRDCEFTLTRIGASRYADFSFPMPENGGARVSVGFR
jgi:hypothetical protein